MKEYVSLIIAILVFASAIFIGTNIIEANIIDTINAVSKNNINATIVLDAGHGGEDGGAVAFDNTVEKDLNLQITKKIALFFELFDIEYFMIRNDDSSVGNTNLETIRKRKASDILKRIEIVNSYENSVLLSIHQNKFAIEKYRGVQVFYTENDDESCKIAQSIQNSVTSALQPENNRKIMSGDKSIYLLYNAKRPSVLVECGFMSNPSELESLKNTAYQSQLAYFIVMGMIDYFNSIKVV